jgi:hypothetical protein
MAIATQQVIGVDLGGSAIKLGRFTQRASAWPTCRCRRLNPRHQRR